jgi:hypothetical protein
MPPLVLLALAGVGFYASLKVLSKLVEQAQPPGHAEAGRARSQDQSARYDAAQTRDLGELEFDAAAGVYRRKKQA